MRRETLEQIAKVAIARRTRLSSVPGNVKLTLTLDIKRELAERLTVRALRDGVSLEAVIIELIAEERRAARQP
jgi:hypothetical protein